MLIAAGAVTTACVPITRSSAWNWLTAIILGDGQGDPAPLMLLSFHSDVPAHVETTARARLAAQEVAGLVCQLG